ncbi:MAG: lipopolysaccharide biosynthesis protein [Oceanospirillaceae bacterium]|nr:lipopolysaccharide biosynthesis protein [Oceanospirillaceae bacterium]
MSSTISKSIVWSLSDKFGFQVIGLLVQLILARMLNPDDFGALGIVMIFITLSNLILDGGFGAAIINKTDVTDTDLCSVFYLNMIISVILYVVLWFTSSLIETFFDIQALAILIKVGGLAFLINAAGIVQNALTMRDMQFHILARVRLISLSLASFVAISTAYVGFGVWSLIFFQLSMAVFKVIGLWIYSKWRLSRNFSKEAIKKMFPYGSSLMVSGVVSELFENIYSIVIGRSFSSYNLGLYYQSKNIQTLPVLTFSSAIENVIFSSFSRFKNSVEVMKCSFRKALKLECIIIFPLMLGLVFLAEPLVTVLFTDKWIEMVPILRIMAFSGMMYPIAVVNMNILKVTGRSDLYFRLTLVTRTIIVCLLVFSFKYGLLALIAVRSISSLVNGLIYQHYAGRMISYNLIHQYKDLWRILLAGLIMSASLFLFTEFYKNQMLVQLILGGMIGGLIYLFSLVLLKESFLHEILNYGKSITFKK